MRRLGRCSVCCFLAAACLAADGFVLFVSTGPLPAERQSPISPSPTTVIAVGDVVHSTFVVPRVCFDVRAPAAGILFVRLSWDPRQGDIDFAFASSVSATSVTTTTSAGQTSAVRSLRVARGEIYQIQVVGDITDRYRSRSQRLSSKVPGPFLALNGYTGSTVLVRGVPA
jgi:hypothetical protein